MEFEWDLTKSEKNLRERGFDFAFATRIFQGPIISSEDSRSSYGQVRMIALGVIGGRVYKVVYTDRHGVRRIISAHKASRQETRKWQSSE